MTRDAKCTFLEIFWKFWKDSGICSLFADSCCTSLISVQSDSLYNENAPPPIPTANDYKAKFMTVTQIRLEILKEKWWAIQCVLPPLQSFKRKYIKRGVFMRQNTLTTFTWTSILRFEYNLDNTLIKSLPCKQWFLINVTLILIKS